MTLRGTWPLILIGSEKSSIQAAFFHELKGNLTFCHRGSPLGKSQRHGKIIVCIHRKDGIMQAFNLNIQRISYGRLSQQTEKKKKFHTAKIERES